MCVFLPLEGTLFIAHPDVQVCPKKMCQMSRFADVFHNQCGVSHISHWPENLRDDELAWAANEDDPASSTGPVYRMFTEREMRSAEAGQEYRSEQIQGCTKITFPGV